MKSEQIGEGEGAVAAEELGGRFVRGEDCGGDDGQWGVEGGFVVKGKVRGGGRLFSSCRRERG